MEASAQETPKQQQGGINKLKYVIAMAIGGVFLWLAFRGANFAEIWSYAKNVSPLSLGLLFLCSVISHLLRAIRWIFLLKPLSDKKVSLFNSFAAVIYGYAVNIAIPRGGEVARLVSISKSEDLPWAGVLSTMFIDRCLDLAMLGLLLGVTLTALPKEILQSVPLLVPGGAGIAVASIVGLFMLPKMGQIIKWMIRLDAVKKILPEKVLEKISALAEQFEIGTKSLSDPAALAAIAILTPAIWFAYWLNNYILIFGYHLEKQVSALNTLVVFTIGSMGVLVPTPGSVGGYHYLVKNALVWTSGLDPNLALSYTTVLHIVCFVVATCVPAFACWIYQMVSPSKKQKSGT